MILPSLPVSCDRLRILLGVLDHATVTSKGFVCNKLHYFSSEVRALCAHHKEKFVDCVVKVDPNDLGECFLLDPISKSYIVVPCTDQAYAKGRTLRAHTTIQAHNEKEKRECNGANLRKSIFELQEMIASLEDRKGRTKKPKSIPGDTKKAVAVDEAGGLFEPRDEALPQMDAPPMASESPIVLAQASEVDGPIPVYQAYVRRSA